LEASQLLSDARPLSDDSASEENNGFWRCEGAEDAPLIDYRLSSPDFGRPHIEKIGLIVHRLWRGGTRDRWRYLFPPAAKHTTQRWLSAMGVPNLQAAPLRPNSSGVAFAIRVLSLLFSTPLQAIVLLEQPETALHKEAQYVLADALLEAVQAGRQLLVETHSEALVRRTLRRMAEQPSLSMRVALYLCECDGVAASASRLTCNEYGYIVHGSWPFGDDFEEAVAQKRAEMGRRAKD
jgi:hypothetical protein